MSAVPRHWGLGGWRGRQQPPRRQRCPRCKHGVADCRFDAIYVCLDCLNELFDQLVERERAAS